MWMLVFQSKKRICVREIREESAQQILRNKKQEKTEEYKITQYRVIFFN
jgi:hypothetical protein